MEEEKDKLTDGLLTTIKAQLLDSDTPALKDIVASFFKQLSGRGKAGKDRFARLLINDLKKSGQVRSQVLTMILQASKTLSETDQRSDLAMLTDEDIDRQLVDLIQRMPPPAEPVEPAKSE